MAEIETPRHDRHECNKAGRLEDIIGAFENWKFDFVDVPALIRDAEGILQYPMVDRDPLPRWSFGRVTLLGDATRPTYTRDSNGAADDKCLQEGGGLRPCIAGGATLNSHAATVSVKAPGVKGVLPSAPRQFVTSMVKSPV